MSYVNFKERKNFRKSLYPKMEEALFYWKCSGDSLSADMSGIETFKEKILKLTIEMDRSSLTHSNEHEIKGSKSDKSRLTAMACRKAKNPGSIKNIELPVIYQSSSKGWMTREVFKNCMCQLHGNEAQAFFKNRGVEDIRKYIEGILMFTVKKTKMIQE
ncbi:hypothetical protein A3Q56_07972 [Intoshia linei]|uniref:DDE-1 domain-containing protein n=1 Tax=Intoshia linei TaxID=1819745 RepID=A0A177ASF2_9BILA|nr:hypothetical protein A3Q56_07972 [Intoshia linei]